LVALLFHFPKEAIEFHSSRASCCTPLLQAVWPQFKASKIEESLPEGLYYTLCNRHVLISLNPSRRSIAAAESEVN